MELSPVPIGIGPVPGGGACNRELRRIPLPRTSVNRGCELGKRAKVGMIRPLARSSFVRRTATQECPFLGHSCVE